MFKYCCIYCSFFLLLALLNCRVFAQTSQKALLQKAYETKSAAKLQLFIDRWAQASSVYSKQWATTSNDTVKAFNELYKTFFQGELDQVIETAKYYPGQKKYFVISSEPRLYVNDSLAVDSNRKDSNDQYMDPVDEQFFEKVRRYDDYTSELYKIDRQIPLANYIPPFAVPGCIVLSLNQGYKNIIEDFLKLKPGEKVYDEYGVRQDVKEGYHNRRVEFLSTRIPMQKRHWGNWWNYQTYPIITSIVFDPSLVYAIVQKTHGSSHDTEYYKKTDQGWLFIGSGQRVME